MEGNSVAERSPLTLKKASLFGLKTADDFPCAGSKKHLAVAIVALAIKRERESVCVMQWQSIVVTVKLLCLSSVLERSHFSASSKWSLAVFQMTRNSLNAL